MDSGPLHPARLPPGTRVGPWRVLERRGWGTYGAVYRALGVEDLRGPVALKVALHPGDGRFAREVELLSRLSDPSVPCLVDHGHWVQPGGLAYPYIAMEWVEGVSLYDWAQVQRPWSADCMLRPSSPHSGSMTRSRTRRCQSQASSLKRHMACW